MISSAQHQRRSLSGFGVIARIVPELYRHELLKEIAHLARRNDPRSPPPNSQEHMRLVRGRFQAGLEACMVAANAMWHRAFQHLLQHLLDLHSAGRCTIFMHLESNSVTCTFAGAKLGIDVICVC